MCNECDVDMIKLLENILSAYIYWIYIYTTKCFIYTKYILYLAKNII